VKLRFRNNGLRLRVNQREVEALALGQALEERIHFPEDTSISYILGSGANSGANASFRNGVIRITVPRVEVETWANTDSIGMYFELPASDASLKIAIEKDLECVDGPAEERDPNAFPRPSKKNC
jgi:hypothetical protein